MYHLHRRAATLALLLVLLVFPAPARAPTVARRRGTSPDGG